MTETLSKPTTSLEQEIASLGPWFHNLHLPDGTQTAPDHFLGDFPSYKWEQVRRFLPEDLKGWTALDIGCNAGFYSIELARRGAHVTGIDYDPHYLEQARWASRRFGVADRIELREMTVYDLARSGEAWDLVLFMGVLYHLRYPLLGLDIVARRVRRRMIFQTLTMPGMEVAEPPADFGIDERDRMLDPGWPKMAFIEHRLAGDPTNWWAPNHAAVEAMLRSAGLEVTDAPGHEIYVCQPGPFREELAWIEDELRAATGQ
jgi:tRNA (mo5U34)-methyltransferase